MITTNNLVKTFKSAKQDVHALRGVTITIDRSDIYGIIGMSGAGKSTLLRCIGLLEPVAENQVIIDGQDVALLKGRRLRQFRQEVGIVFQGYHLYEQKNVYKNIAFPLEIAGVSKADVNKRVSQLLALVDLGDKEYSYPSQLSGGQQQRVAIARALANNPKILLCDEPTSALDPLTIRSVENLLEKINREMGVTIVIITHEIGVVRNICRNVAVLNKGVVIEHGPTAELLLNPKSEIGKQLLLEEGGH